MDEARLWVFSVDPAKTEVTKEQDNSFPITECPGPRMMSKPKIKMGKHPT